VDAVYRRFRDVYISSMAAAPRTYRAAYHTTPAGVLNHDAAQDGTNILLPGMSG